jgi:hypothetical protein
MPEGWTQESQDDNEEDYDDGVEGWEPESVDE